MKPLRLFLFITLGFVSVLNLYAQSNEKEVSLVSYFKLIETQYDVLFSYADDEINNTKLKLPKNLKSLKEHLNYLQKHTPFKYISQSDKNILVIPQPYSKNVCIAVYDKMNKTTILNSVLKYDEVTYKANEKGQFNIPVNTKNISFIIVADDFKTKQFTIDTSIENDCFSVSLNPYYEILDEVVLTNLLTKGIQKIASGGLEINYKEFGLLPGLVEPDVLQSLQALPGITSRRESVSYLNVRGGTHDQNLFLWDGIKMYNTSHFFGMISAFNPYMTKKVSLIKNGTSSKYGDGVSSLINMKTSHKITDSLEAEIGMNLVNIDAMVEAPLSKSSSIEISSRQSINSVWESPTYDAYFDKVFQNTQVTNFDTPNAQQNDDFNFFDTSLSYKHQLTDKDYLKTNFFYAKDEFSLKRFESEGNLINTRSSDLEQTNLAGGLYYERDWSQATTSQLQFYASRYNQNAQNVDLINQQSLEQINEVREYGFKLNLQTQLSSSLALESGYQFNETGILNSQRVNDPEFFRETENSIISNSIYSQLNYQSQNNLLNLSFGGRLNHFSKFDDFRFEPRFNLSYQFIEDLYLEVLAEQKSQVTSQIVNLQTDFLGVENRRWVLSDPENRPIIESQQVSAGLNFVKPNWFINIDFYYKEVDGITTRGQGFQNQFELSDTHGSYDVKGMDLLINKNFDPISGWVSYSLSKNTYHFEELTPTSFHNNLDIRHVVSAGLSYEKNGLKVSTGFNWHSGATKTSLLENQDVLTQQIQFEAPNASRLKDYFRLDFSSTYTFNLFKNIEALTGVSFLNVLGNDNVYNQFYQIGDNQNIHMFRQNGLGFTPNFVFRVRF